MNFSTAYHEQTDSKTEIVNQVVEDMLRMYVMNNSTKWEDYFHLAEFTYNTSYRASSKMSPFEVLDEQKCRTPVTCDSLVDWLMLGPDFLMKLEHLVTKVQVNLKEAQYFQWLMN